MDEFEPFCGDFMKEYGFQLLSNIRKTYKRIMPEYRHLILSQFFDEIPQTCYSKVDRYE